ncbi:methyltransferase domain-containing protein [Caldivirga sp. UBA161]|uniref:methyltransferase domain-containing protein n=1 Tax=Caldivirga sp. UBA161 TaxID=1915569 RepID=UPI0025BE61ED|nr:methyltransferase domain-containing protein [Caldivirga sp. UBA161]
MPYDVPYVPSPEVVVRRMLQVSGVRPGEVVYDLGCGDGRIVIMAAKEFGARAVCVEIRNDLYEQTLRRIKELNLDNTVKVIHGNFFEVPIEDADVVTMYLLTSVNQMLRPKLERELRPGTRVVSHDFEVPGWKPILVEDVYEEWRSHKIYLFKIPGAEIPILSQTQVSVPSEYSDIVKLLDGRRSIEEIAQKTGLTMRRVREIISELEKLNVVKEVKVIK